MTSSNDIHTTRRRNNRNRQAALSFLSTIKLDPSADQQQTPTPVPTGHQQQQQQQHKLLAEVMTPAAATTAQPITGPIAAQQQQQDAVAGLHPESPLATDRASMAALSSPTVTPTSPKVRPSVDQSRYGKREHTATTFLSGIKLRTDVESGRSSRSSMGYSNTNNDERPDAAALETNKDDQAKRLSTIGRYSQDDNVDDRGLTPRFEPSEPMAPRTQPPRRSISSPSLLERDRHQDGDFMHAGGQDTLETADSISKRSGSNSYARPSRLQRTRHASHAQERSGTTLPNLFTGQRNGGSHRHLGHAETHTISPRHSPQHQLIKPTGGHWLTPFTSTASFRSLAGHASSTIARKLFRRPSFSLPRRVHRSATHHLSGSRDGLSRARSHSSLQSSASYRERRARRMTEDERHIIYHGVEFTKSSTSLEENLNHHAVMYTTSSGSPLILSSVIRYQDDKAPSKSRRRRINREYLQQITKEALVRKKANSYAYLLSQSHALSPDLQEPSDYDPYFLDDPELKTGKNRTVISLACYMGSVIQYTRPSDLKRELNEHFRSQHPDIDPSITLSKIRKIKSDLLAISEDLDLEISTVSLSYAYFEKLILKGCEPESDASERPSEPRQPLVTKENRKLVACVCLLLAYKVNEPKRPAGEFSTLMKTMYKYMYVSAKDIKDHEFQVFAQLDFNLNLPRQEVLPHFEQILYRQDYLNVQEYLGDDVDFFAVAPQHRKLES